MTGVLIRRRNLETRHTHREDDGKRHREKTVIYQARREAWHMTFPHSPQGNQPYQHLDLGLLGSRTVRQHTSVV